MSRTIKKESTGWVLRYGTGRVAATFERRGDAMALWSRWTQRKLRKLVKARKS